MLRDIENTGKKKILCYLNGAHHFDLFYNIFNNNKNFDFYIYSEQKILDEYRKHAIYALENVFFVQNFNNLKYKLTAFGALITVNCQQAFAHAFSLKLVSVFNKLQIPVIEMQHGLFQLGISYYDCPIHENFKDDSLPSRSFADHILTYYPVSLYENHTMIGYPLYNNPNKGIDGSYVLVLSNLHWSTYSLENKYNFYKTIFEYAQNHPDKTIIWKMHQGEVGHKGCQSMLASLACIFPESNNNVLFCHKNDMLKRQNLATMIKKSDFVISTISTTLLECEMYNKVTYIYKCEDTENLADKIKRAIFFENYQDLMAQSKKNIPLKTGFLYKYDNDKFVDCINRLYKTSQSSQKDLLEILNNMSF